MEGRAGAPAPQSASPKGAPMVTRFHPARAAPPSEAPAAERPGPPRARRGLPESRRYRLKRRLLGPPLVREQLATERLSNPVALAVLSSDVLSSSAYAT